MIVMGLRKPEKDETNGKDKKRVISTITSEARLDEGEFMRHVDKVHPVGGTKNDKQSRIIKLTTNSFEEMTMTMKNIFSAKIMYNVINI